MSQIRKEAGKKGEGEEPVRGGEMAEQPLPAVKPEDLISASEIHMAEGENWFRLVALWPPTNTWTKSP